MPKRAVTPPPGDDEPRYLTVIHPYPLHPNMELVQDRENFGRWLACCIGPDPFYAFFYKPSALNTVIIEVAREFDSFHRLLGEHRWSEFLKHPSEEEKDKVTRVYYCRYNSGRQVQKMGWKRIDTMAQWFKNWSPNNELIRFPYPETHYCDSKVEDPTNVDLSRPLPATQFPQSKPIPQPVVRPAPPGSTGWITQKSAPKPVPSRGAWGKGVSTNAHIAPAPGSRRGSSSTTTNKTTASPWVPPQTSSTSTNPWTRGSQTSPLSRPSPSITSPTRSMSGGTSSSMSASSSPVIQTPPAAPPGLPPLESWGPAKFSWADEVEGTYDIVNHKAPSTLPPLDDYNPPVSSSWPAEHPEVAADLEGKLADLEVHDHTFDYAANWEQDVTADTVSVGPVAVEESESLWNDYEEEQKTSKEDKLLCSDHGRVCKKGICQTYSRQLAAQKRAEQMANNPRGRGRGGGRGKGRGSGGRGDQANDWRDGPKAGSRANSQSLQGAGSAKSVATRSSGSSTPLNASSADDDDGFSVISGSKGGKKGRTRSNSIKSTTTAASSDAWGAFAVGQW